MSSKNEKTGVIRVIKPKSAWRMVAIVSCGLVAILSVCAVVIWIWKTADRKNIRIDKIDKCRTIEPRYTGASKHPAWIKIKGSNCFVFDPYPVDNESVTWTGGCECCLASGKGVFQWFKDGKPGTKYAGIFARGMPNGYGISLRSNGTRYEGNHKDWEYHGKGKWRGVKGTVYEGDFEEGKFHGKGKWRTSDKHSYVGEWRNGRRHGRGTYFWSDGTKYKGNWVAGKMTGNGTKSHPKGITCTGQFKDGHLHGQARCAWNDGWTYDGEYKVGMRHGQGSVTWPDGTKYKGSFTKNRLSSPEKAETQLFSMCKIDIATGEKVKIGKPSQVGSPSRYEVAVKYWVTNNEKVPVKIVETIEVVPHVRKHKMGWFAAGLGFLHWWSSRRKGKDGIDSLANGITTAMKVDKPSRDVSELRNRSGTQYGYLTLKSGESGWLRISTGHVANGIQAIRNPIRTVEWPEGRLFDPTGCFQRWLTLYGSKVKTPVDKILMTFAARTESLADEVRRSYFYRCRKKHHQPTCDYLDAVGYKSPTRTLIQLCNQRKDLSIGQMACARIKLLEQLSKVR